MRNKLLFITGIGVGYVLGTKAGRERYEQMLRTAQKMKENPTVQEAAGVLQAQAGGLVTTAKDTVNEKFGHTTIGSKVTSMLSAAERSSGMSSSESRPTTMSSDPMSSETPTTAGMPPGTMKAGSDSPLRPAGSSGVTRIE